MEHRLRSYETAQLSYVEGKQITGKERKENRVLSGVLIWNQSQLPKATQPNPSDTRILFSVCQSGGFLFIYGPSTPFQGSRVA